MALASLPTRPHAEGFGATARKDPWWAQPTAILAGFAAFIIYGTWAAFQAPLYQMHKLGPYVSPFESPNLFEIGLLPEGWSGSPLLGFLPLTAALLILWIPGGFRFTCYFCRRCYHRAILTDPAACSVSEFGRTYRGEQGFFWINNFHRYFLYLILIFVVFHWVHFLMAFWMPGEGPGIGVGTLVTGFDTIALTMYVGSCHSVRHLVGGGHNRFTNEQPSYKLWSWVSRANEHHGLWFWLSLLSVGLADLYMRLLAHGVITDLNTWSTF